MKGFEKFILVVFSIIVIVTSVFVILTSLQLVNVNGMFIKACDLLIGNKTVVLIISSIFILFGLIGIFSSSSDENEGNGGMAIKSEKGTVFITKDTFESIILAVSRNYPELRNVKGSININENGVFVNVYAFILPDTVVTTLTSKLQDDIKNSILKQTTVEVKDINIKIKGVYIENPKK